MKYFATLFAIASMAATGIRADPIEGHQFTVNLVTDVWDLSVTSPGSQVAIHFNNATIKHSFWNKTYSIVGGLVFNDTKAMQTYAVHTDQWQKTVDITLEDIKDQQHVDIALSRDGQYGELLRFDKMSGWEVDVKNEQKDVPPEGK